MSASHYKALIWLALSSLCFATPGCRSEDADAASPAPSQSSGSTSERAGDESASTSGEADAGAPQAPPAGVRTATSERGRIARHVPFTGELLADTVVDVAALETGRIEELLVDEGDLVEAGDPVAVLDDELQGRSRAEARTRQQSAEARLSQAEAELEAQRNEVERRAALVSRNAFPQSEYEQLVDRLAVLEEAVSLADAQVDEARAYYDSTRVGLARREIDAPVGGVVVTRHVSVGEVVSSQTPLVTLIDESTLRLVARISEQRIAEASPGTRAEVTFDSEPNRVYEAVVTRVGEVVDRQSRTVQVELRIEADYAPFRHGMFARGRLITDHLDDAVLVPVTALQQNADGTESIWVVRESIASRRTIETLLVSEQVVAVSGIEPGVQVILSPGFTLQEGARVYVVNPPEAAGGQPAEAPDGGGGGESTP